MVERKTQINRINHKLKDLSDAELENVITYLRKVDCTKCNDNDRMETILGIVKIQSRNLRNITSLKEFMHVFNGCIKMFNHEFGLGFPEVATDRISATDQRAYHISGLGDHPIFKSIVINTSTNRAPLRAMGVIINYFVTEVKGSPIYKEYINNSTAGRVSHDNSTPGNTQELLQFASVSAIEARAINNSLYLITTNDLSIFIGKFNDYANLMNSEFDLELPYITQQRTITGIYPKNVIHVSRIDEHPIFINMQILKKWSDDTYKKMLSFVNIFCRSVKGSPVYKELIKPSTPSTQSQPLITKTIKYFYKPSV